MAEETIRLARYAAGLRYEDLSAAVVQQAKNCIIDTVAAGICGSALPWSRIVVDYAERTGPGGKCRIFGRNGPAVQAPAAALANGALAHAFELDSLTRPGAGAHPGATVLPPALAIAQERGADGRASAAPPATPTRRAAFMRRGRPARSAARWRPAISCGSMRGR
jgi:2-methylcitrate dehydratase PrpD